MKNLGSKNKDFQILFLLIRSLFFSSKTKLSSGRRNFFKALISEILNI